ncbi:MAG: hypothetical protein P8L44_16260 [Opitutales bacterium]|nr:hypothetical protein [Opitutales bacterium]
MTSLFSPKHFLSSIAGVALLLGVFSTAIQAAQSPEIDFDYERSVHQLSHDKIDSPNQWAIALDEVAWKNMEGSMGFERISDQKSLSALTDWVDQSQIERTETPHLVVYNKSDEETDRGIATRDVVVTSCPRNFTSIRCRCIECSIPR